jgi:hypothetical protein
MTMINSRGIEVQSAKLCPALIEKTEQDAASTTPKGMIAPHQRHRDADEARAFGRVLQQPFRLAHHVVDRHHPASAPDISIATIVMRKGLMPA